VAVYEAVIIRNGRFSSETETGSRSGLQYPLGLLERSVDKYPRTTYEYGNHVYIYMLYVSSYNKVDAIEQRNMVNSGVGGTEQEERRSTSGLRSIVSNI
jgi:hypothetical protein